MAADDVRVARFPFGLPFAIVGGTDSARTEALAAATDDPTVPGPAPGRTGIPAACACGTTVPREDVPGPIGAPSPVRSPPPKIA